MEFRGRRSVDPEILSVRELTREEVANVKLASEPAVKKLRDSHHMVARLIAMGVRPLSEVGRRTGYGEARIAVLQGDPAFQNLVAEYRKVVDDEYHDATDEYFGTVAANRTLAAQLINDKLNAVDDLDDVSLRELVAIHGDAADRTGYAKRTIITHNFDFAAKLDNAINRSNKVRTINHDPTSPSGLPSPASEGRQVEAYGASHSRSLPPAPSKMRRIA